MKIVVSPAKTLDYESKLPTTRGTQPEFLETASKLNRKLSRQSKNKLSELMSISDKLADLNYTRYQEFQEEHDKTNSRPAMYAFNGDVYTGLDSYTIPTDKLDQVQNTLRILSGMYGILRPLDLIQPYRLEMGTSIGIERKNDLYEVWQRKVTDYLNSELEDDELFLNLASNEYFKAVDTKKLKVPVISPVFKDFKNGKLKIISFFAKKARGSMVRYIIDNDCKTLEDVKGFDYDDYRYSEEHTDNENEPTFIR
ncbi:MAG TPA: peroxide stress protein YaaA [Christiangramia sp.]|nr:peroxide stress protein YaaA [Christiangramia sp.]